MVQEPASIDLLYQNAENLAQAFSLFPRKEPASVINGLLTEHQIEIKLDQLHNMEIDAYIAATVAPTEESTRPGARDVINALGAPVHHEKDFGPLYTCELEIDFHGTMRTVGFITQDRAHATGVWGPEHHTEAAKIARGFAIRSMPIVTFMDTPGADPYEEANSSNQAHSISKLITELCHVDVPTLGIIIGQGYSGGAIPLAASNMLLCLRTGVFNTIHPRSLANLVRRYNLSWQECAKFVGVSSYELYKQGNIDGIVDYDPGEDDKIDNLRNVIVSGILSIEDSAKDFVSEHPEILDHYHRNIHRYLHMSETMVAVHADSPLKLRTSPTEYPNVFGVALRHLRYLVLRRRIKATSTTQYGRLVDSEIPEGELDKRVHRERREAFLGWLQEPDKVLYEDSLNKVWKNFVDKRSQVGDERGRIAQLIFGEPGQNYENARKDLCLVAGLHLYNRWKASSKDNIAALIRHLEDDESNSYLLETSDIGNVKDLLTVMGTGEGAFIVMLKSLFSFEGKKLFDQEFIDEKNSEFLLSQLVSELNLILESENLYEASLLEGQNLSIQTQDLIAVLEEAKSNIPLNRLLLEDVLWPHVERKAEATSETSDKDETILDVIQSEDVRDGFAIECQNLIVFSIVYENLIGDMVSVARQAHESRTLSAQFIEQLLKRSVDEACALTTFTGAEKEEIERRFAEWIEQLAGHSGCASFLKSVEEWIRVVHKDKSDTLFVVISFFFEKLLPEYYASIRTGRRFDGKIEPVRIGRRKDFWNRLTIAYRDLLFHELLTREKRSRKTTFDTLLERFVDSFEETSSTLMSANPVSFPTFRASIESALNNDIRPHGLITGIGDFKTETGRYPVGLVISNVHFQAGSIDNSDCARFCNLLVECARKRLPVICFISSGGMQTKEGAAALFTMAVINDRVTRFVRDNDLPIIMFGFGDCTGGAQASFVTHPLAQTYYFTGSSMPFAGQAVVERNLPFTCLLSNYLSLTSGAMRGLVKHPFAMELDKELRAVDPAIPLPTETIEQVVDRIMAGSLAAAEPVVLQHSTSDEDLIRPIQRILIHARGCTAVKLVSRAQEFGYGVVLVQSDPDMDSVPADMVRDREGDVLVCIGGNTSDESYLNALSVLSIAEAEKVDSLHPGIGFLSEDPNFANLVRQHGINFIGPTVSSMETMGNKSNA
ncbi:MAG: carbamoyl-phosphate synthase large subunit, partial [Gammaproteobacteria bacterium]|nr:carbamoyl-phosphate synthase large subunit [Gammaproteobacteria bacterium]